MKKLLLAGLLGAGVAGCTGGATDSTRSAVSAYLKKSLNDPTSYEGVRWGNPAPYTRRDSATVAAEKLSAAYDKSVGVLSDEQRAKIGNTAIKLENITDTTRVGTRLIHAYRAKNKLGATVLDSAQFVVYKSGQVQQL